MSTEDTAVRNEGRMSVSSIVRLMLFLRGVVDFFGKWGSFLILPLIFITVWDVFARKLIFIQIFLREHVSRFFESTLLQELEWHFHTALFVLVLGYGYIHNTHVRVDLIRENLVLRKQAWIEFLGCTFFMIPYCLVVIYFASIFAYESFMTNEVSASLVGLGNRFIIKGVLGLGVIVAALAGIAVWLQSAIILWGPPDLRFQLMTFEWPEDIGEEDDRLVLNEKLPGGDEEGGAEESGDKEGITASTS